MTNEKWKIWNVFSEVACVDTGSAVNYLLNPEASEVMFSSFILPPSSLTTRA
jgi:hypothetical protein